jgi:hypothetical protein
MKEIVKEPIRRSSRWGVPVVAFVVVTLAALSLTGVGAAAAPTPSTAFAGYGLGNFTAPFHVAKTFVQTGNNALGCSNTSYPVSPYVNPVTGRSVTTNFAQASSCPAYIDSFTNPGFAAQPSFLLNSAAGAVTILVKMTVRSISQWNYTAGSCTAAANGSAGACQIGALFQDYSDIAIAQTHTGKIVALSAEKVLPSTEGFQNGTCSAGSCSGWTNSLASGSLNVITYLTFSLTYTMSSSLGYLLSVAVGGLNVLSVYGSGASLTGAYVQESSTMIWSVNSILIT